MDNELTPMSEIRANVSPSIFEEKKNDTQEEKVDKKNELVNSMFEQAVVCEVSNNAELKKTVLETAQNYTKTKMEVIKTDVDTEKKIANFNNKKDACESYGFNEKTTPIWATNVMTFGYNIMLAIWLFLGSFTFMPIIFIAKKVQVGLKKSWLAIIVAILLYLIPTVILPLVTLVPKG